MNREVSFSFIPYGRDTNEIWKKKHTQKIRTTISMDEQLSTPLFHASISSEQKTITTTTTKKHRTENIIKF